MGVANNRDSSFRIWAFDTRDTSIRRPHRRPQLALFKRNGVPGNRHGGLCRLHMPTPHPIDTRGVAMVRVHCCDRAHRIVGPLLFGILLRMVLFCGRRKHSDLLAFLPFERHNSDATSGQVVIAAIWQVNWILRRSREPALRVETTSLILRNYIS